MSWLMFHDPEIISAGVIHVLPFVSPLLAELALALLSCNASWQGVTMNSLPVGGEVKIP